MDRISRRRTTRSDIASVANSRRPILRKRVDGRCSLHPNAELELINEENYFFRFSRYQQPLLDLYAARPDFVVVPDFHG